MTQDLQQLARRQLADYDARTPGTLFAEPEVADSLSLDDAYRIQLECARLRQARGEAVAGYKIGCVSEEVRRQLGVTHPVFGHVFENEIRKSGAALPNADFDQLGIEGELAVRMARDIDDPDALLTAPSEFIQEVLPVIELHHYVSRGAKPGAVELVANNALQAGIVACEHGADWKGAVEISVSINGEIQGTATFDPLPTLHELARRLEAHGLRLGRGQIALTGSPLPLYRVSPGDRIEVDCPAIGQVTADVTD